MTKESLEQLLVDYGVSFTSALADRLLQEFNPEICEDAISRSRQAAIDTIESWLSCDDYNNAERNIMRAMQSILYDLPSVKLQEPKTGRWIECEDEVKCFCSECKEISDYPTKFCPNCGTKMIEPQESEVEE